jgi:hypothetical protein
LYNSIKHSTQTVTRQLDIPDINESIIIERNTTGYTDKVFVTDIKPLLDVIKSKISDILELPKNLDKIESIVNEISKLYLLNSQNYLKRLQTLEEVKPIMYHNFQIDGIVLFKIYVTTETTVENNTHVFLLLKNLGIDTSHILKLAKILISKNDSRAREKQTDPRIVNIVNSSYDRITIVSSEKFIEFLDRIGRC